MQEVVGNMGGIEETKVKVFDNMEKLTGNIGFAIPYANEIHLDSKYSTTEFGEAIVKHEKKHIENFAKILDGKNRFLVYTKNNIWDFFDITRLAYRFDKKVFCIKISELILFLFIIFFATSQLLPVFADAPEIEIQGVNIISEGGYFHFYIKNKGTANITIAILNFTESQAFLQTNDSITYHLEAPRINSLYENVTYIFWIRNHSTNSTETIPYTVTVVKVDLPQRFAEMERQLGLYVPLLMITTGICIFIGTSFVVEQVWKFVQIVKKRKRVKGE